MTDILHEELDDAIAGVMAEIVRLDKSGENKFAQYNFTSVDDYKDHIRPLLAARGIAPICKQTAFEMFDLKTPGANGKPDKTTATMQFTFDIALRRKGVQTEPEAITVALPYTGAQTTGAARSYAIKEWLKTKFLASSGDVDAEAAIMEPGEYSGAALPKAKARDLFADLQDEMRMASTSRDPITFKQWATDNSEKLKLLPPDWQAQMRKEYLETLGAMTALENMDRETINGEHDEQR